MLRHPQHPRLGLSVIPAGSWSRCVLTGTPERVPSGLHRQRGTSSPTSGGSGGRGHSRNCPESCPLSPAGREGLPQGSDAGVVTPDQRRTPKRGCSLFPYPLYIPRLCRSWHRGDTRGPGASWGRRSRSWAVLGEPSPGRCARRSGRAGESPRARPGCPRGPGCPCQPGRAVTVTALSSGVQPQLSWAPPGLAPWEDAPSLWVPLGAEDLSPSPLLPGLLPGPCRALPQLRVSLGWSSVPVLGQGWSGVPAQGLSVSVTGRGAATCPQRATGSPARQKQREGA